MPSNHLIFWHPLLLSPSIIPSIRVFSNESVLHIRWPKYWSFRFSISPSNEYLRLISFKMDWLDLLAVQGTLKSLLQHYSSSPGQILWGLVITNSVQFSSVTQLCPTLCNPMNCSTPGFPVHHQLPELAQTHTRWVGDAIQPSHNLLFPSPPALSFAQHQGLF